MSNVKILNGKIISIYKNEIIVNLKVYDKDENDEINILYLVILEKNNEETIICKYNILYKTTNNINNYCNSNIYSKIFNKYIKNIIKGGKIEV